jgi:hypothetical protein
VPEGCLWGRTGARPWCNASAVLSDPTGA